ncbi:MAG TPA: GFA family protein [Acetobacteraceae bacterium]|nr:GFA family protein [Acetobacteraceae bacterium]
MTPLTGRCLCRAVTFAISAAPLQIVHCHCDSCRRNCSAPVASFLIVPQAGFRYMQGMPKVYQSSRGVRRSFCDRCGTPLAYETDRRPDQIDLYVCSLDDSATIAPHAHVHADEQLPWFEILDDLPRYVGSLRDAALLRRGPRAGSG